MRRATLRRFRVRRTVTGSWRARYVDEEGHEHAKGFTRKADAHAWLDNEITAKFASGTMYPRGRIAPAHTDWSTRQVG
jgi:hypothetical protein